MKTYFGRQQARSWFDHVAQHLRDREAAASVDVFVVPSYPQLDDAISAFSATNVAIGAQDVSAFPPGAYTGEVSAAELAETGIRYAEIGHAERRRLFGETDEVTASKVAATLACGITPVLCLGEADRLIPADAAAATVAQLHRSLAGAPPGPVVVAYEPVWAIGAPESAPTEHIATVARALRSALDALPARSGSRIIYGGSAGPGLLTRLGDDVDGLFLGRFGHDPDAFIAVVDEAGALVKRRREAALSRA